MPCYAPSNAWYTNQLGTKGKRQITFNRKLAHFPTTLKIPCGKCIGCLQDRSRKWAIRCLHESKLHEENCFITLTYDPEKIPKGHTLKKSDLQNFMKRFRKSLEPKKVRFYACGEYGSKTFRPHYHILIFGWSEKLSHRRILRRSKNGPTLYNSLTVNRAWPSGHAVIGDVTSASCFYVAGYVSKNLGCKREYDVTCGDGEIIRREKEFSLMSRRPGLGSGYVEKYQKELVAHDNVIHEGREMPLPRYYYDQLLKGGYLTENVYDEIKTLHRRLAWDNRKENYPDRRRTRENFQILKLKHFTKGEI